MEDVVFLDTCIVIDYLKNDQEIIHIVEKKIGIKNCFINDIIVMELIQGAKNRNDLRFIQMQLNKFMVLDINQSIMSFAKDIISNYFLSHNAKIPDAIIAASCITYDIPLITHNIKDFEYLKNIKLWQSSN